MEGWKGEPAVLKDIFVLWLYDDYCMAVLINPILCTEDSL